MKKCSFFSIRRFENSVNEWNNFVAVGFVPSEKKKAEEEMLCIDREERGFKIGLNHQLVKTNGNWMSSSLSIAFLYPSPEMAG